MCICYYIAVCLPHIAVCVPDIAVCVPDIAVCLPDIAQCLPDIAIYVWWLDVAICLPDIAYMSQYVDVCTCWYIAGLLSFEGTLWVYTSLFAGNFLVLYPVRCHVYTQLMS